jgi:hypothetical protein
MVNRWHSKFQSKKIAPIETPNGGHRFVADLYGGFSVKWFFGCCRFLVWSGRPFLVPSPAIRFAERAEGVKGPKC